MPQELTTTTAPQGEVISGLFQDVSVITELRGSFPENIDYIDGVNIEELTRGDVDPMYLTIPIGRVGSLSGNKRYYDEEWTVELERQVLHERPVGIMGHIKPEDRASSFPIEAVHWVGAARLGDTLWGKGYIPPGPDRDRIRRYKATGRKLATSIFAKADGVWDAAIGAYRMVAKSLKLQQIDIAPYDRAGVPSLAIVPILTAEMDDDGGSVVPAPSDLPAPESSVEAVLTTPDTPDSPSEEIIPETTGTTDIEVTIAPEDEDSSVEDPEPLAEEVPVLATPTEEEIQMEREEIISEMTPADTALIPATVRDAIIAEFAPAPPEPAEVGLFAEVRTALGGVEPAQVVEMVLELTAAREEARKTAVTMHIAELVDNDETGIRVTEMRPIVKKIINGRSPQSIEEVDTIFAEVVEDPEIVGLLGRTVQETMGPSQTTPVSSQAPTSGKFYRRPELPAPKRAGAPAPMSRAEPATP
jgi:hypothetical protein